MDLVTKKVYHSESVDNQLYFSEGEGQGQEQLSEDQPGMKPNDASPRLGRFVREAAAPIKLSSPETTGRYFLQHIYTPIETFDQEELWVLLLNSRHQVTHEVMVYRGQVDNINIRVCELFKDAIRLNMPKLIMAHNHPSSDLHPSADDLALTNQVREAAKLLSIVFVDHLILGKNGWLSMKREGFMPSR